MEVEKSEPNKPATNQKPSLPPAAEPPKKAQRPKPRKRAAAARPSASKRASKPARSGSAAKGTAPQVTPDPAGFAETASRAYQDFLDKLEAAWHPVDLSQSAYEAEREMQEALARFDAPHQELERCEARIAYLRAVRSVTAPERQSAQIASAFSRYLDAVRTLWRRPDLDGLDPRLISALGESIAWAGYYASQRPGA
jgi:hypothetical protein